MLFYETSAHDSTNVHEAFTDLITGWFASNSVIDTLIFYIKYCIATSSFLHVLCDNFCSS